MNNKKAIIFFTKYTAKGPSSRYRSYQFVPYLENDFDLQFFPLFSDSYIDNLYGRKRQNYIQIFKAYFFRLIKILQCLGTDKIVFIEYELLPYFPPIMEYLLFRTKVKMVVDYDDAIFHNYNQSSGLLLKFFLSKKIDSVIKYSTCVISGSPYLSTYIQRFNANCVEIPTSVSIEKYGLKVDRNNGLLFTIGWIGSITTSVDLINIVPAFEALKKKMNFQLNLIGFDKNLSSNLANLNVNYIKWDSRTEIEEIKKFDVGIMPLENTPFRQGKCGFKLVQYMACSLPTISTPLDANIKINRNKKNLHAVSIEDWVNAIEKVYIDREFFITVGQENYKDFEKYYSTESNSSIYLNLFEKLINL